MLKRFIPLAGLFALMVAFMVGCQDSPATGPQSTSTVAGSEDPYTAYLVPDQALNDAAIAPTFDQVMNDPSFLAPPPGDPGRDGPGKDSADHRDTTHRKPDTTNHGGKGPGGPPDTTKGGKGPGGPPPPDSTHHKRPDSLEHKRPDTTEHRDTSDHRGPKPPQDSLRLRPINYGEIISQLHLTKEQDSAIRLCFRDLNDCTRAAATRYRDAVKGLRDALQAALADIRAAVDSGRITRDEAKTRVDSLVARFRQDAGALEAAYRQAVETCRHEFERCVASHLTPEQLKKWQALVGK